MISVRSPGSALKYVMLLSLSTEACTKSQATDAASPVASDPSSECLSYLTLLELESSDGPRQCVAKWPVLDGFILDSALSKNRALIEVAFGTDRPPLVEITLLEFMLRIAAGADSLGDLERSS